MEILDLQTMPYRDAWALQERIHDEVVAGAQERLLLVEHPPVITFGRRPGVAKNVIAPAEQLEKLGVEVVESDRGGDVTFHGPGQLVAYPIIRLNDHGLSVGGYVRRLQQIVIDSLNDLGIPSTTDPSAIGVWTEDLCQLAKICAFGVRIRRGVSMHGLALNVATDLRYFDLIVPCGLSGRSVTSIQKLRADAAPSLERVKEVLVAHFKRSLAGGKNLFASAPVSR